MISKKFNCFVISVGLHRIYNYILYNFFFYFRLNFLFQLVVECFFQGYVIDLDLNDDIREINGRMRIYEKHLCYIIIILYKKAKIKNGEKKEKFNFFN